MELQFEDDKSVVYRFGCNCHEPGHAIDVDIYKLSKNDVSMYFYTLADSFWFRLKWCWKMLTTGKGFDAEFTFKSGDVSELARILTESDKI